MSTELSTTSDVICALGGASKLSRRLGVAVNTISMWRGANRFPAATYIAMQQLLEEHGAAAPDELWAMRSLADSDKETAV